jgi:hypothetical protein
LIFISCFPDKSHKVFVTSGGCKRVPEPVYLTASKCTPTSFCPMWLMCD